MRVCLSTAANLYLAAILIFIHLSAVQTSASNAIALQTTDNNETFCRNLTTNYRPYPHTRVVTANNNQVFNVVCDPGYVTKKGKRQTTIPCNTTTGNLKQLFPRCRALQASSNNGMLCRNLAKNYRPHPHTRVKTVKKGRAMIVSCDRGYLIKIRNKGRRTAIIPCAAGKLTQPIPRCRGCDPPTNVTNGTTRFTMLHIGSKVSYSCDKGYWLDGRSQRRCGNKLKWSGDKPYCKHNKCLAPRPFRNGKVTTTDPLFYEYTTLSYECNEGYELRGEEDVVCIGNIWSTTRFPYCIKKRCPTPGDLENGRMFGPRRYYNGTTVSFSCSSGFNLYGSQKRTCQSNYTWSGTITTCDDRISHCRNPGIPDGARKSGKTDPYNRGDIVKYSCQRWGFKILGSETRKCLSNRTWSGTEPKCVDENYRVFPSINETAELIGESFVNSLLQTTCSGENITCPKIDARARSLGTKYKEGLDLIFVLDGSSSIKKGNFDIAKKFVIRMVDIFGVDTRRKDGTQVACVTFGNTATLEFNFGDVSASANTEEKAKSRIKKIAYQRGGTAIKAALEEVKNTLLTRERRKQKRKTVIFIITDGNSNIGGDPKNTARDLKRGPYNAEIYVIGIGKKVKENSLRNLASRDVKEKHIFNVEDFQNLEKIIQRVVEIRKEDFSKCGRAYYIPVDKRLRIVGGAKSVRKDWPWAVKLVISLGRGYNWCGGTIINEEFILTAAHCFNHITNAKKVNISFEDKRKAQETATNYFTHNNYNKTLFTNDIALVQFGKLRRYTRRRQHICLPRKINTEPLMKTNVFAVGWGTTKPMPRGARGNAKDRSKELKQVEIPRIDDKACAKNVQDKFASGSKDWYFNSTTQFCAADLTGKNDTCQGDSGGPAMVYNPKDNSWLQVGIVSWGHGCAQKGEYGYYTKVSPFLDWIDETIRDNATE